MYKLLSVHLNLTWSFLAIFELLSELFCFVLFWFMSHVTLVFSVVHLFSFVVVVSVDWLIDCCCCHGDVLPSLVGIIMSWTLTLSLGAWLSIWQTRVGPHFVLIQWHSLDVHCHGNSEGLAACLNSWPFSQSEHAAITSTSSTKLSQDWNILAWQEGLGLGISYLCIRVRMFK